jgi:hypothetical protein
VLFLFKCGLASKAGLRHLSGNNSGGSATEVSFTVAQSRIGGNSELASSGEQLEARLGGLVLDYSTDPSVCSIYSALEWWC